MLRRLPFVTVFNGKRSLCMRTDQFTYVNRGNRNGNSFYVILLDVEEESKQCVESLFDAREGVC